MSLADDLLASFLGMTSDAEFASGMADAYGKYLATKMVDYTVPPPTGGIAPGPVRNNVTAAMFQGAIATNDAAIAAGIAAGIIAGAAAGLVPTPPLILPAVFVPIPAPLVPGLNAIFNAMKSITKDGDKYFADEMADLIETYCEGGGMT